MSLKEKIATIKEHLDVIELTEKRIEKSKNKILARVLTEPVILNIINDLISIIEIDIGEDNERVFEDEKLKTRLDAVFKQYKDQITTNA